MMPNGSEHDIVQASPTQVTFMCDVVTGADPTGKMFQLVRVQIASPVGLSVYFFAPEDAKAIANRIRMNANQALILPKEDLQ